MVLVRTPSTEASAGTAVFMEDETVEEYVFIYFRLNSCGENFNERFDMDLFCCKLGVLTPGEAQDISVRLKTQAIKTGLIDRKYYEKPEPEGPVSTIRIRMFRELDGDERLRLLETEKELRERLKAGSIPEGNDPFFLLSEACKYAELLREERGNEDQSAKNNAEADHAQMDRILGTMVYVLMKREGIDADAAKDRLEGLGRLKPEWKERSFTPVSDIDIYSDGKDFFQDKMPTHKKEKTLILELLKAAVIAIQLCEKNLMSPEEQIAAWGPTAYRHAAKLKRKMGLLK